MVVVLFGASYGLRRTRLGREMLLQTLRRRTASIPRSTATYTKRRSYKVWLPWLPGILFFACTSTATAHVMSGWSLTCGWLSISLEARINNHAASSRRLAPICTVAGLTLPIYAFTNSRYIHCELSTVAKDTDPIQVLLYVAHPILDVLLGHTDSILRVQRSLSRLSRIQKLVHISKEIIRIVNAKLRGESAWLSRRAL